MAQHQRHPQRLPVCSVSALVRPSFFLFLFFFLIVFFLVALDWKHRHRCPRRLLSARLWPMSGVRVGGARCSISRNRSLTAVRFSFSFCFSFPSSTTVSPFRRLSRWSVVGPHVKTVEGHFASECTFGRYHHATDITASVAAATAAADDDHAWTVRAIQNSRELRRIPAGEEKTLTYHVITHPYTRAHKSAHMRCCRLPLHCRIVSEVRRDKR